ncbi:MAG: GNAT family N-acetyltransferase [Bacilli bacterium]|nr:GNAT family N-acetyltransferase [Bacilli bacterium]
MNLHFEKVTINDLKWLNYLTIKDSQINYVESIEDSLLLQENDSSWKARAIYDNQILVGFVLYGFIDNEVWIDRYLIDQRYQGRGYGKNALKLIIEELKKTYQQPILYLSVFKENNVAINLYQKLGFEFNGQLDSKGELVMELKL